MGDGTGGSDERHSFLTGNQEQYLAGELADLTDNNESTINTRIKQRTVDAIQDFGRLTGLPDGRKQAIFESLGRENMPKGARRTIRERMGEGGDEHLPGQLAPLFRFIYEGAGRDVEVIEEGLRHAIDWSEWENPGSEPPAVNVRVDLDVQIDRSAEDMKDRLEAGDELTDREVRVLLTRGDEIGLEPDELRSRLAGE